MGHSRPDCAHSSRSHRKTSSVVTSPPKESFTRSTDIFFLSFVKVYLFYFMCVSYWPPNRYVNYMCSQYPQRLEERVGSLELELQRL